MNNYRILFIRGMGHLPNTGILLVVTTQPTITTTNELITAIRKGVANWMLNTEEGKKFLNYAGDDFNIGDLTSCNDKELLNYLTVQGIISLKLEDYDEVYEYDTSLAQSSMLEEQND